MKRTLCSLAAGLATGLIVANAEGASVVVINDNFDSYANQAAFETVWLPIGTTGNTSAILSVNQANSPPKSIEVPGVIDAAGGVNNGQYRNRRNFAETGPVDTDHQIVWSFDFFDSNAANSPYRSYSNLQDSVPNSPTAANQLVAIGLNNNQTASASGGNYYMARILGFNPTAALDPDGGPAEVSTAGGSGAFFKLNDFGVGVRSTGWHNLKVIISTDDGNSTDYAFYVDGLLAERVSNVGSPAQIRGYDNITLGSGLSNTNNLSFFDNVLLEHVDLRRTPAVPLPAAAPAGLALLGLTALKRRR